MKKKGIIGKLEGFGLVRGELEEDEAGESLRNLEIERVKATPFLIR